MQMLATGPSPAVVAILVRTLVMLIVQEEVLVVVQAIQRSTVR